VQQHSSLERLTELEEAFNQKEGVASLLPLREVCPGQLCLAPSSLDGKFYRAVVVTSDNPSQVGLTGGRCGLWVLWRFCDFSAVEALLSGWL